VRLLGVGELKSKVELEVAHASASARAAVEKAGGSLTETIVKAEKAAPEGEKSGKAKKKSAKSGGDE
jgi:large subunit ribosomal protein L15